MAFPAFELTDVLPAHIIDMREELSGNVSSTESDRKEEVEYLRGKLSTLLNSFDITPSDDQKAQIMSCIYRFSFLGVSNQSIQNLLKKKSIYVWIDNNYEIVDFTVALD